MRRIPFLLLVYLVIGVVVAYSENYFDSVERTKQLVSAILAVLLWPLILVGFDVKVT
jgi:ABC-type Na+ efflux pump permease subunit